MCSKIIFTIVLITTTLLEVEGQQSNNEDNRPSSKHVIELQDAKAFIPTAIPPLDQSLNSKNKDLPSSTMSKNLPGRLKGQIKKTMAERFGLNDPDSKTGERKRKRKMVYGSWPSPINADIMSGGSKFHGTPQVDPVTGRVFWVEITDKEVKNAIHHYDPETGNTVRWMNGGNVQSLVHEYGGQPFVVYNNTIYYTSVPHLSVFKQTGPNEPVELLSRLKNRRYADGCYSPHLNALFWVVEDHDKYLRGEVDEPENMIVMMDANTGEEETIMSRASFFAAPRISLDGKKLTWVQWNHPHMPWGSTRMFVAKLGKTVDDMTLEKYLQHGSMMMPKWNINNELFYVHDMTGWWNLYVINKQGFEINLTPASREIGWPLWWLGWQAFDVHPQPGIHEVVVISGKELHVINTMKNETKIIKTEYDSFTNGIAYSKDGDKIYAIAGNSFRIPQIIEVNLRDGGSTKVIRGSPRLIDKEYISLPTQIQFPTTDGDFAYGYLYYPENKEYEGPGGNSKPPLIVKAHGGPTGAATTRLNPIYQYFTSRGYALLDVDYRGSTGYGKLYRSQIHERWGDVDVADVKAGADYLIKEQLVDPEKICISGFSAGAFTSLNSLIFSDTFKAGTVYFGISDLLKLREQTHKFESHYLDYLIGKPSEHEARYKERSPIFNVEKLDKPALLISGANDPVVPPNQTLEMHNALKRKGLPTAKIIFPDEGHGMQIRENLKYATKAELVFYSKIFRLQTDVVSDIQIDNLNRWNRNATTAQSTKVKTFILS